MDQHTAPRGTSGYESRSALAWSAVRCFRRPSRTKPGGATFSSSDAPKDAGSNVSQTRRYARARRGLLACS